MKDKVVIFDTTLRDGEQSPGASMNAAEKLRIAIQLEKLGVDVIEAGFPAASEGDFKAVQRIASKVTESVVCGLSRILPADIKTCFESIKEAAQPRIHTFVSTSEIHLKYQMRRSQEDVLEMTKESVKFARNLCENVEFSAMDASRTERDYLCKVFEAAIDAGATTINLPDTVGYAIPHEFRELIEYVMNRVPNIDKAILSIHCHNDLGLATSNSLAALMGGARQVEVAINGIGERAGNTALEEIVMALHTRPDYINLSTDIKTEYIYQTSRLVTMITGMMVQPNKAIVGANAFAHESGIHQDGLLKNAMTYEIMKPETIGLSSNQLVLGKLSGKHALKSHLEEMGYNLSDEELSIVFKKFKDLADKKKHIMDEDLESLVTEGILRTTDVFELEYLLISSGTTVEPMASAKLKINGRSVKGASYGNGPIDAVFNTIATLASSEVELLRFSVSALSGGTDSQGEVTVRMRENGIVALGRGADPDIITASAKAFVNGLNRIEYLKKNPSTGLDSV